MRSFVIILTCILFSSPCYGELRAFLDRSNILETQTVEFTLRANQQGEPDFTILEEDFNILSTRTNSQYQSINGRVSSWIDWNLTLEPKSTGVLTIPPFLLNGEKSESLSLHVTPLNAEIRRAIEALVYFETDISADSVYVQAQLIYTRKLFYVRGAQLYGETAGTPQIQNAVVKPIANSAPTTAFIKGRQYSVIEQTFAIFPEQSGTLIIPAAMATGNVRLQPQDDFAGGRTRIRAVSDEQAVTVKPIPVNYPASEAWLPATDVTLIETWGREADNLMVGIPATRTLRVRADNSVGSVIPPLKPEFPDGLRSYPSAADISEQSAPDGYTGIRNEAYSLVAQRPGTMQLPAIRLTWWDTDTDTVKTERLAERYIEIAPNPLVQVETPIEDNSQIQDLAEIQSVDAAALPESDAPKTAVAQFSVSQIVGISLTIAAILAVGFTVPGFLRFLRASIGADVNAKRETASYKALQAACSLNIVADLKAALSEWMQAYYNLNTNDACQAFCTNSSASALLGELNRRNYAAQSTTRSVQQFSDAELGAQILETVNQLRQSRKNSQTLRRTLPELYPIQAERFRFRPVIS